MLKINAGNEKIKIKYFGYLKDVEGYSTETRRAVKNSLYRYEEYTDFEDYSKLSKKKALGFKAHLEAKKHPHTGKPISLKTRYDYLRHVREFFKWLSGQSGFKSKISINDVAYLKLSKEENRMALSQGCVRYPTMDEIKQVISSINISNEIDLRDRAVFAFTLLSGARDMAIITLPLQCFDENTLIVDQDPVKGVKTKFKKHIISTLFKFDDELLGYVLDWVRYLKVDKQFKDTDPLFPRNRVENNKDIKKFVSTSIEPYFWESASSIRDMFKRRFENAGVEYYSPHTFRHLAVKMSTEKCRDGQELKAVSQNFGHENVGTTMTAYAKLPNDKVSNIITGMDFSPKKTGSQADILNKIQELIKQEGQSGKF